MKTLVYCGLLHEQSYRESESIFVGEYDEPLSEMLEEITGKQVSVRYWITDEPLSKKALLEEHIKQISGCLEAKYFINYSDLTGYLWTDEDLNIGGHDLLNELSDYLGKYIYLEIDVVE